MQIPARGGSLFRSKQRRRGTIRKKGECHYSILPTTTYLLLRNRYRIERVTITRAPLSPNSMKPRGVVFFWKQAFLTMLVTSASGTIAEGASHDVVPSFLTPIQVDKATSRGGSSSSHQQISATASTSFMEGSHVAPTTIASDGQSSPNTLVVGGGLGGIAAAVALKNIASIDNVHVIESRSAEKDSILNDRAGAAMQLGPNAFRALEAIGGKSLLDQVYQEGSILQDNFMMLPGAGVPSMKIPYDAEKDTGYPMVLIRWGVLRRLLAELLPDAQDSLVFGKGHGIAGYTLEKNENEEDVEEEIFDTIIPVTQDGEPVSLGASFAPELIVGADGVHSVFRQCINSDCQNIVASSSSSKDDSGTLKDNGRVNIKAAVPVELSTLGGDFASHSHSTFVQFDPQVACFAGPAGPGFTYWAISIGDDANGKPFYSELDPSNDPVAAKNLLLDKLEESSSEDVNRDWIIRLVEQTDPRTILINRSVEAPVEVHNSFVSKDGKVVLLGDAAHAMNPAYGQSASFAFEDAATLATAIRDGRTNGNTLQQALQDYSDKRVDRCREMQRRSEERAAKAMRGEQAEDVSKWIYAWDL